MTLKSSLSFLNFGKVLFTVFMSVCALFGVDDAHAEGSRRLALVVGHNVGTGKDVELKYAEQDALQMAGVLKELGGFDNVDLMTAPSATQLVAGLEKTKKKIDRYKTKGEQVFFVFFYSGHADDRALHLGGTQLQSDELIDRIEKVGADLRLAIIDACQSGSMVRDKGLIARKPINIELEDNLDVKGQAILASTSRGESAQESDALSGSFFTSYLITGLRGAADKNLDGVVTLVEAYSYAFDRTISSTVVSSQGIQHPTYDMDLRGKKDVVLTWPERGSAFLRFRAATSGSFLIIDKHTERVVAEVDAVPSTEKEVGLPEGIYKVKKRSPKGLLEASVLLHSGSNVTLIENHMLLTPYVQQAGKGAIEPEMMEDSKMKRPWTWAASATALAALSVGSIFMGLAAQDYRKAKELARDSQNGDEVSAAEVAKFDDRRIERRNIGTGVLAVGGAFAAAALTLYFVEGRRLNKKSENKSKKGLSLKMVSPWVSEHSWGWGLQGMF